MSREYSPRRGDSPRRGGGDRYDDRRGGGDRGRDRYDDRPRGGGGGGGGRDRGGNRDDPTRTSVLLRNLSRSTRDADVRYYAEKYGPVRDVYLPKDYYTKEPRGIGFIEFGSAEDAEDALRGLNRRLIDGREVVAVFAEQGRKKPTDFSRGGGGGGRGGGGGGGGGRHGRRDDRDRGRNDDRGRAGRERRRSYSRSPPPPRRGRSASRSPPPRRSPPPQRSHSPVRSPVDRAPSPPRGRRGDSRSPVDRSPVRRGASRSRSRSPQRAGDRSMSPRDKSPAPSEDKVPAAEEQPMDDEPKVTGNDDRGAAADDSPYSK